MNQAEFITRLEQEHNACVEISRAKNADYAQADDAFANFRVSEMMGIPPEDGILVRMTDKFKRAANLIHRGGDGAAKVKDESVADTLRDLSNYALILLVYLEQK